MPDLTIAAVLVGAIVAFVAGAAYYGVLGAQLATVSDAAAAGGQMRLWQIVAELARCLVLATVVAGLAVQADVDDWAGGLALGLVLWVGFPLVLWTGAMLHENTPWKLAAIHGGDWLVKLLLLGLIGSTWQ
jgi:hypothetical protein